MAKITFAQAAEQIAKKKAKLEAQYEKGDKWTKTALEPQLANLEMKLEQLQEMNEQARSEKLQAGFNRFMKKYGGYLPKAELGLKPKLKPNYGFGIEANLQNDPNILYTVGNNPFTENELSAPTTLISKNTADTKGTLFSETPSEIDSAAQLAHPLYNLIQGMRPIQKTKPVYNPYESKAIDLMSNYRYNANPQLAQIEAGVGSLRTQARNAAAGSGRDYMRYAVAAENLGNRSKAEILNTKEQAEQTARFQLANTYDVFGRQRVMADVAAESADQEAYANRRRFTGQGLEDISLYDQRNIRNRQMAENDEIVATESERVYGRKVAKTAPNSIYSYLRNKKSKN